MYSKILIKKAYRWSLWLNLHCLNAIRKVKFTLPLTQKKTRPPLIKFLDPPLPSSTKRLFCKILFEKKSWLLFIAINCFDCNHLYSPWVNDRNGKIGYTSTKNIWCLKHHLLSITLKLLLTSRVEKMPTLLRNNEFV
jgi:hypothetical protein